ncbi:MAG TPA: hypothetical protein VGV37_26285 [Aliidongia sp.]|uniref:hypothetical protein n=1 Tax=Aliidongia sp. TaxID=1914230 RepID=UPI002DDD8785|nr:hypothetical protein [Aliidongia sp.]HEV2678068.1 hypothetical protein [Aliidongia sp.]
MLQQSTKFLPVLVAGLALAAPFTARAQTAVATAHPQYTKALTDLRLARALLMVPDDTPAKKFSVTAAGDIDQAMAEIKRASIDDGKSLDDHPPIDANVSHRDRLHEAQALIESATRDLNAEEDDKAALGWRAKATKDVADAHAFVLAAVNNEKDKPKKS